MSGKLSFLIIGILTVALIAFTYYYSTPNRPLPFMQLDEKDTVNILPAPDTAMAVTTDTTAVYTPSH
jgi:hypothetical protein